MTLTCPFLLPVVVPLVREPRSNHRTWRLAYRIVRPVRIGFRFTADGDEFSPCLGQSNHCNPSSTFFRAISRSSLARLTNLTKLAAQAPPFKAGVSRLFLIRCVGSVRIVSLWRVALPLRLRRSSCSSTGRGAFFSARGTPPADTCSSVL